MVAWLNRNILLPGWAMVWASLFCLMLMLFALWILMRQPWLGIELELRGEHAVTVQHVYQNSPAEGQLEVGDVIVALIDERGDVFKLEPIDLQDDHSDLPTFLEYRRAMQRQKAIADLLSHKRVGIRLQGNESITLQPAKVRPLSSVPVNFWIIALIGSASFLIGFATWRLQSGSVATRIFFISGIGIAICSWATAIFVFRELALSDALLVALTKLSVFGAELTAFSCAALIWAYPRPIARYSVVPLIYLFVVMDSWRILLEVVDIPGHSFYFGMVVAVPFGLVFSIIQWHYAAEKPDDRAILKWVNLSIYIAVFLVMTVYFLPIVVHGSPFVGITFAFVIMLFVFLGFAFAITRYRLFDIERLWSDIWLWFLAGLTILVADLVLVLFMNINQGIALTATLIVVGWMYFPVRQRLWAKIFRQREIQIEDYLPKIAAALTGMEDDVNNLWRTLLKDVFQPLVIEEAIVDESSPRILDDGLALAVPGGHGVHGLHLQYADRGRRLFHHGDVKLSAALCHLVFGKQHSIASYMEGMQAERQRIVRDLHDDVAGKLLAMKLIAPESRHAHLADEALKALRSVIYSLDSPRGMCLQDASIRWYGDMRERCEAKGIVLELSFQDGLEELMLSPKQMLNYERIVHEGVTNAIVHSMATIIQIDIRAEMNHLVLEMINDGNAGGESVHLGQGRGLLNIAQRMSEMRGRMEYFDERDDRIFRLYCIKPIEVSNAENIDSRG
jgi:signal transduction histidine kinase